MYRPSGPFAPPPPFEGEPYNDFSSFEEDDLFGEDGGYERYLEALNDFAQSKEFEDHDFESHGGELIVKVVSGKPIVSVQVWNDATEARAAVVDLLPNQVVEPNTSPVDYPRAALTIGVPCPSVPPDFAVSGYDVPYSVIVHPRSDRRAQGGPDDSYLMFVGATAKCLCVPSAGICGVHYLRTCSGSGSFQFGNGHHVCRSVDASCSTAHFQDFIQQCLIGGTYTDWQKTYAVALLRNAVTQGSRTKPIAIGKFLVEDELGEFKKHSPDLYGDELWRLFGASLCARRDFVRDVLLNRISVDFVSILKFPSFEVIVRSKFAHQLNAAHPYYFSGDEDLILISGMSECCQMISLSNILSACEWASDENIAGDLVLDMRDWRPKGPVPRTSEVVVKFRPISRPFRFGLYEALSLAIPETRRGVWLHLFGACLSSVMVCSKSHGGEHNVWLSIEYSPQVGRWIECFLSVFYYFDINRKLPDWYVFFEYVGVGTKAFDFFMSSVVKRFCGHGGDSVPIPVICITSGKKILPAIRLQLRGIDSLVPHIPLPCMPPYFLSASPCSFADLSSKSRLC